MLHTAHLCAGYRPLDWEVLSPESCMKINEILKASGSGKIQVSVGKQWPVADGTIRLSLDLTN
ncbi:hypothetical protein D1BOALGB6SA_3438 [Olavius sp. associated proteobacterium Delta 1]|nr:hypothetical protein D1BOALGB6SA_3438 [Olavius sp. associated proteobacterium Delta 1]